MYECGLFGKCKFNSKAVLSGVFLERKIYLVSFAAKDLECCKKQVSSVYSSFVSTGGYLADVEYIIICE
jgi:hypothetical protein